MPAGCDVTEVRHEQIRAWDDDCCGVPLLGGRFGAGIPPSAPSPLNFDDKFRLYLRQTYSLPSLARLSQPPVERGAASFRFGAFSAFGVGAALHEDPRFFPSGKHGMWRRTAYVVMHTVIAHPDRGTGMPAFGN